MGGLIWSFSGQRTIFKKQFLRTYLKTCSGNLKNEIYFKGAYRYDIETPDPLGSTYADHTDEEDEDCTY